MLAIRRRILGGVGANAYSQIVSIATQLAALPLFLSFWTVEAYGVWLTLSAIPAYLAIADAGFISVAGNRVVIQVARNRTSRANRIFSSAVALVLALFVMCFAIATAIIYTLPGALFRADADRTVLAILIVNALITQAGGLPLAAFRANHQAGFGTFLDASARAVEWISGIAGLILVGTPLAVAFSMFIGRLLAAGICLGLMRALTPIRWSIDSTSLREMRVMIRPSLAYVLFPISNAISIQGFTLACSSILGPSSVVIFNTYRTLARLVIQMNSIFSLALWPEFSKLYGVGEREALWLLFYRSAIIGAGIALSASAATYFLAPSILQLWTKGRVGFEAIPVAVLMIYSAIAGVGYVFRILLLATNKHASIAIAHLVVYVVTLGGAVVFAPTGGMIAIVCAMLAGELFLSGYTARAAIKTFRRPNWGSDDGKFRAEAGMTGHSKNFGAPTCPR